MNEPEPPLADRYAQAMRLAGEYRSALAAGSAESLPAFLDRHASLRDVLSALIGPGVQSSAPSVARPTAQDRPTLPEHIGPFRILGILGQGGMGTVYLAEQTMPVQRRVALKVIRTGLDSRAILARFERERQALARMNHDAIARVFDVGTTDAGQPYFAMELVEEGVPLTHYCDRHRLSVEQRLELFQQVCAGVQHAHQKGLLHRDLKPSNILVCEATGGPAPKIIDFGLAQGIDRQQLPADGATEHGMLLGTPEYMAPEQAAGDVDRIDTRSDTYALGVLLHELLCGELPFSRQEATLDRFSGRTQDVASEPPRPSSRIAAMSPTVQAVAESRQTSPRALVGALRGDLDWIVLKAISWEPGRRYQSPAELAADLHRHLAHEVVLAGPPSTLYRLQKFLRRHRRVVTSVAVLLVLATMAGTLVYLHSQTVHAAEREAGRQRVARQDRLIAALRSLRQPAHLLGRLQVQPVPEVARQGALTELELQNRSAQANVDAYRAALRNHVVTSSADLQAMFAGAAGEQVEALLDELYWLALALESCGTAVGSGADDQTADLHPLMEWLAREPRPWRKTTWELCRNQLRHQDGSFRRFVEQVDLGSLSAEELEWLGFLVAQAGPEPLLLRVLERAEAAQNNRFWVRIALALLQEGDARNLHSEAAVTLDQDSAVAWHVRGLHFHGSDVQQALSCYERSLQLDPSLWQANLNRTALLADAEAGAALMESAIATSPNAVLYWRLAERWRTAGKPDRAIEACDRGLALYPTSSGLWGMKGECLCWLGRFADSLPVLEQAIRLDPANFHARNHQFVALSQLWATEKERDRSQELAKAMLASAEASHAAIPSNGYLAFNLGLALLNNGQGRTSFARLKEGIEVLGRQAAAGDGEARKFLQDQRVQFAASPLHGRLVQMIDTALAGK